MTAPRDTWVKPPFIANPALRWAVYLGAIAYFGWVGLTMPIDWDRVAEGIGRAGKIFGGAFPPSFERSGLLIDGFLESLKIAVLATAGEPVSSDHEARRHDAFDIVEAAPQVDQ